MGTLAMHARLLRQGRRLRLPREDTRQLGADAVVDREGRLHRVWLPSGPDQRPPVADIIDAVRDSTPDDRSDANRAVGSSLQERQLVSGAERTAQSRSGMMAARMTSSYDLVVIGGGAGDLVAAREARRIDIQRGFWTWEFDTARFTSQQQVIDLVAGATIVDADTWGPRCPTTSLPRNVAAKSSTNS